MMRPAIREPLSPTRDALRENLLPYLDRAWAFLPPLSQPRVLDVGCGTGVATLRLAELTDGVIIALDIDEEALGALRARFDRRGLSHRIQTLLGSLTEIPFTDSSFDIVWCEGALFVLGFPESLRAWRRLLRAGGFLVAHDEAEDVDAKLRAVRAEGYDLLGHFEIPEQVWWSQYYGRAQAATELAEDIRRFRQEPQRFRSAYFVLQRQS
jgi:ubiquinone/menaquinone biosynthesis C-methylase UbiE